MPDLRAGWRTYPEVSQSIDVESLDDLLVGALHEAFACYDTRIINQNGDSSDFLFYALGRGVHLESVRDVHLVVVTLADVLALAPQLLDHLGGLLEAGQVEVPDDDLGAELGELDGHESAEA